MKNFANWLKVCFAPEDGTGATAPEPTPAPAPAETAPTEHDFDETDVKRILEFDPFGDEPQPKPAQQQAPVVPTPQAQVPSADGQQPQGAQPALQAVPPVTPAPQPKSEESELELLKKSYAEAQAQLRMQQAQGAQPQQPAQPKSEAPDPLTHVPAYQYTVPPQLLAGLRSEDPAEQAGAVGALIQGVSQTVHQQVLGQMRQAFQTVPQMVYSQINTVRTQQEVFQDFYGSYPELNRPELYPVVAQCGAALMQETGQMTYSPQMKQAIAARVKQLLGMAAPVQQPTPAPAPSAPGPYMSGGAPAARPTAPVRPSEEDDIANTIFGA